MQKEVRSANIEKTFNRIELVIPDAVKMNANDLKEFDQKMRQMFKEIIDVMLKHTKMESGETKTIYSDYYSSCNLIQWANGIQIEKRWDSTSFQK